MLKSNNNNLIILIEECKTCTVRITMQSHEKSLESHEKSSEIGT